MNNKLLALIQPRGSDFIMKPLLLEIEASFLYCVSIETGDLKNKNKIIIWQLLA